MLLMDVALNLKALTASQGLLPTVEEGHVETARRPSQESPKARSQNFWNRLYWVAVSHYQTVDRPLPVENVIEPDECLQMCCKKKTKK